MRWISCLVAATVAVLAAGGIGAGDERSCLSVKVSYPPILPDGSTRAPGALKVCRMRKHSPVRGLCDTSVDGEPVGMFSNRFAHTENARGPDGAVLVLVRNERSKLAFEGFLVRPSDHPRSYLFSGVRGRQRRHRTEGLQKPTDPSWSPGVDEAVAPGQRRGVTILALDAAGLGGCAALRGEEP